MKIRNSFSTSTLDYGYKNGRFSLHTFSMKILTILQIFVITDYECEERTKLGKWKVKRRHWCQ